MTVQEEGVRCDQHECLYVEQEGGLLKVVELIHGGGTEAAVQKAAWTQLAFLLEDPNLHKAFMKLCSLPFLVQTFIISLKVRTSFDDKTNVMVNCLIL